MGHVHIHIVLRRCSEPIANMRCWHVRRHVHIYKYSLLVESPTYKKLQIHYFSTSNCYMPYKRPPPPKLGPPFLPPPALKFNGAWHNGHALRPCSSLFTLLCLHCLHRVELSPDNSFPEATQHCEAILPFTANSSSIPFVFLDCWTEPMHETLELACNFCTWRNSTSKTHIAINEDERS